MKRILISGYYGFGNTGDEAVLSGICASFRELGIAAEVTVISADPQRTVREHPGVRAISRSAMHRQWWAMLKADLFISGGGSLFQDATSARSPYYYLAILNLARASQCKTMIYAQGVGPLIRPGIRNGVANAFGKANAITVRDAGSKALLEEIGVTREVRVVGDPAYLVEPDYAKADALLREAGIDGKPVIGVALRPWPGHEKWLCTAAAGISALCEEMGAVAAFIPMQETEDSAVSTEEITLHPGGDPQVAKALVARCEMVVGMRLHSLIFAAACGVPFVPMVYDPKVSAFASGCGMPAGVEVGCPLEELTKSIRQVWTGRKDLAAHLHSRAGESRDLALESARVAAGLLE